MKDHKITPELLIHEVAHVWQSQHGGADYMTEALWSQQYGHGYDWQASVPQTPWERLEPEQQAELLETVYGSGYFDPNSSNYGRFRYDVDGDGQKEDLTAYVEDCLRKVGAGVGAP